MIKLITLLVILCFDYGNGGTRVKRGTPGGPLGFRNNHLVPGKHYGSTGCGVFQARDTKLERFLH